MNFLALACLILVKFIHCAQSFDAFESGEVAVPMLEFYKSLNGKQLDEFIQITSNPAVNTSEFRKQMREFLSKNNLTDAYKGLKNAYSKWKEQMFEMASKILTGPAAESFLKIKALLDDKSPNLTLGEQCARLNTILANADPMVRHFLPNEPGDFLCLNGKKKKRMFRRMEEDFDEK